MRRGGHRSAGQPEGLRTPRTRQTAIRERNPGTPTGGPRKTQCGATGTETSFGMASVGVEKFLRTASRRGNHGWTRRNANQDATTKHTKGTKGIEARNERIFEKRLSTEGVENAEASDACRGKVPRSQDPAAASGARISCRSSWPILGPKGLRCSRGGGRGFFGKTKSEAATLWFGPARPPDGRAAERREP